MSDKVTMRKTRSDENSKNSSMTVRSSTRIKSQTSNDGNPIEVKRKTVEKKVDDEKSTKNAAKHVGVEAKASKQAARNIGAGEPDGQAVRTVRTHGKASAASRSGVGAAQKSSKTPSGAVAAKPRSERKSDGEKRGTSTIYMPKASGLRASKPSEHTGEGRKEAATLSTRSDNHQKEPKPTSTRIKDAPKAAVVRSRDNAARTASSRTKVEAAKITTGRSKDDSVRAAAKKNKEASVKSKNQYATRQRLPSRERRRSRTLSPSEVKVLGSDKSKSGLGTNKVVTSLKDGETGAAKNESDGEECEEEFDTYDSEVEECIDSEVSEASEVSSKTDEVDEADAPEVRTEERKTPMSGVESRKSDEERMLDSGHYELAEARRRAARVQSVTMPRETKPSATEIILEPNVGPFREERCGENKSLPSSMDEGFEDSRSGDFAKSPTISRVAFIDFRKTAKTIRPVASETPQSKVVSRGKKLLEMIKLNIVEWSILESKPIAYEEFIRTHGRFNTRQMCVQTNEDNLDVETQTEPIERSDKWTQFPTKCRTILKNDDDVKMFNMERLGVGSDLHEDSTNVKNRPVYDVLQLNEFLSQAGKVVLSLLEERGTGNNDVADNVHEFPFTESIVKLSIDSVAFLAGRSVTIIHYSNVSNRVLLTIHAPVDEEIETTRDEDYVTDCSIGCVWNILQPSRPIKLFYSPSPITACCFHSTSYNVVLAGLEDGSISLWDLAEAETWHRKIVDEANNYEWCVRSPTYSSNGNFDETGHDSEIVALRVLSKIEGENFDGTRNKFMPIQVCSLDANGRLIVWSVLRNMSRTNADDLGLSWWGDMRLVKSQELSYSKKFVERENHLKGFSDMHIDRLDTNALYIATNTTNVLHATRIGKHANPPAYKSSRMDWCGDTKCIENCPFDQPYFLVGCADGTLRLHSTTAEKPLLQLKNEASKAAIKIVQWSRSKPLTFYVLDVDSKIHVWDLGKSDMFPSYTISTEKWSRVQSIQLSPCRTAHEMTNQYMALASDNGGVEVHRLKEDFCHAHRDAVKREINTFLRYVAIL